MKIIYWLSLQLLKRNYLALITLGEKIARGFENLVFKNSIKIPGSTPSIVIDAIIGIMNRTHDNVPEKKGTIT